MVFFINFCYISVCRGDIWDYALEGEYDFPNGPSGEVSNQKGDFINLNVELKGFYKNGEDWECTSSARLIRYKEKYGYPPYSYYLDTSFLKEIFGELNHSRLKLDGNWNSYFTIDFNTDYNRPDKRLLRSLEDIIDCLPGNKMLFKWNETVYRLESFILNHGELTQASYKDVIFEISGNKINLKIPSDNNIFHGIVYRYSHHRLYDTNIAELDNNYFCITGLTFTIDTADKNIIENAIDMTFKDGIIHTYNVCNIDVFGINGIKFAHTIGNSLDISNLAKGTYIIKAHNQTLKVSL